VFIGAIVALAGAAIVLMLLWDSPVGLTRAEPGTRYRVGPLEHELPVLRLPSPRPRLIRASVLAEMARLLRYADAVLTEQEIPFWISCGTLLGAIRHQGFIPWDDDIDVQLELRDRTRLVSLTARFKHDGFVLLEAAGGYKLACDNRWRYPYIDLVMVERVGDVLKLCYPLTSDGRSTFAKAVQWPNECLEVDDVFPLVRVPFEFFTVPAPGHTLEAVRHMYGESSLNEARASSPGRFIPWIVNHRTNSLLFALGLSEG